MNILLSIKPHYIHKIVKGIKEYEFRKSIFKLKNKYTKVYIYSTTPVKMIVGFFTIEAIIEDEPKILWTKFQSKAGINKNDFFEYFKNRNKGYAIKIARLVIYEKPINPYEVITDFTPPQSFYYLNEQTYPDLFSENKYDFSLYN